MTSYERWRGVEAGWGRVGGLPTQISGRVGGRLVDTKEIDEEGGSRGTPPNGFQTYIYALMILTLNVAFHPADVISAEYSAAKSHG